MGTDLLFSFSIFFIVFIYDDFLFISVRFNLSTYPFLNSVPDGDDIDFKCDGLHDGFYASIKYSCQASFKCFQFHKIQNIKLNNNLQLYHHCIYGIRHDFLCANFTAFDQKTFICHFVSEVNCKSSAKYWFR